MPSLILKNNRQDVFRSCSETVDFIDDDNDD